MKKGFTLLELLATIAIMAVLIAAILPFVANYTAWAKRTTANRSALIVADAINRYNSLAPSALTPQALIDGTEGTLAISNKLQGVAQTVRMSNDLTDTGKFIAKPLVSGQVLFSSGSVSFVNGDTSASF